MSSPNISPNIKNKPTYCTYVDKSGKACQKEVSIQNKNYCRIHAVRMLQTAELNMTEELAKINPNLANSLILHTTKDIDPRVKKLLLINDYMPDQRTKAWYEYRKNIMTASPAGAYIHMTEYEYNLGQQGICCYNTSGAKIRKTHIRKRRGNCVCFGNWKEQVQLKCIGEKPWTSSRYTRHGIKYEDAICAIYERQQNTKVLEFGIMPHPTIDWLGASPDGITTDGKMVEIKAPSRTLTKEIIIQYWIQMQLQMEVCDLEECDFVEARIVEYNSREEYLNDKWYDEEGDSEYHLTSDSLPKGFVITIEKNFQDYDSIVREHIHPPSYANIDSKEDEEDWIKQWIANTAEQRQDLFFDKNVRFVIDYYKVIEWEVQNVKRDRKWFELRKPDFEEAWNLILKYRKEGVPADLLPRVKEQPKITTKPSDYLFADDSDDDNATPQTPQTPQPTVKKGTIPMLDLSIPSHKTKNELPYETDVFT